MREITQNFRHLAPADQQEVGQLVEQLSSPAFATFNNYEFQREVPLQHSIGSVTFSGVADALDLAGSLIVDYKTDRTLEPAEHLPQMAVYAQRFGVHQAALVYLRHGYIHRFDADALERGYQEVEVLVRRMMQHDFDATPDPHTCRICPYRGVCDQIIGGSA